MSVAGIVAEYNPFHRGHAWQIAQTRKMLGEDAGIICVMSGNWVQRGECAVTDKWSRARLALAGGADLVLELPTPWAASSAEFFARGAVSILAATGVVDTLSFGSERGEIAPLRRIAQCLESPAFQEALRALLPQGGSFAACRQRAADALLGSEIAAYLAKPNDNLAVEYLRALPPQIHPLAILRIGAEHDGSPVEGYASASALRSMLRRGTAEQAAPYLTQPWTGLAAALDFCERAVLARLRSMTLADFQALPDSGEGLAARLQRAAQAGRSLEEVYTLAKTKRYAHARLRRMVLWAFLGMTVEDRPKEVPYLRVLGFGHRGQALLRDMRTSASRPVLLKPAHIRRLSPAAQRLFALESRCTDLFALCYSQPGPCGLEFTTGPVVAEREKGD